MEAGGGAAKLAIVQGASRGPSFVGPRDEHPGDNRAPPLFPPTMLLVTGADGFAGRALVPYLAAHVQPVRAVSRRIADEARARVERRTIGDLRGPVDWAPLLEGIDAVVHLAGLAHVLERASSAQAEPYFAVNTEATCALAQAAAAQGVRRLVFLSSVKVYGDAPTRTLREDDALAPSDPYGESKRRAEDALREIAAGSRLEVVVLRPPLMYGPGVKANFLRLLGWVDRGLPLPLGALRNRRSLLGLGNLGAAIATCIAHPRAANRTFNVADREDVSTPELLRKMAAALGKRSRLVAVPPRLVGAAAMLAGRGADWARLAGDLAIDTSAIRETLGFVAPQTLDAGLAEVAAWYRAMQQAPAAPR